MPPFNKDKRPGGLGRIYIPDPRDKQFPMRAAMPLTPFSQLPLKKTWRVAGVSDQGHTSHCVGHAWAAFLRSRPFEHYHYPGIWLYKNAQKFDSWPGENYLGSSGRGGAKYLESIGEIQGGYHWAKSISDIIRWLLTTGPVVVGTDWLEDMFHPDFNGVIKATGSKAGGHEYLLVGVDTVKKQFTILNSWGPNWGKSGRAYISFTDFELLLRMDGEACAVTKTKLPLHTMTATEHELMKVYLSQEPEGTSSTVRGSDDKRRSPKSVLIGMQKAASRFKQKVVRGEVKKDIVKLTRAIKEQIIPVKNLRPTRTQEEMGKGKKGKKRS